jgi:hypothetical protein
MGAGGEGTMDGKTAIKRAVAPSHDPRRSRPRGVGAGSSEQAETLRARLITATVELVAEGSDPRLVRTRHTPQAA